MLQLWLKSCKPNPKCLFAQWLRNRMYYLISVMRKFYSWGQKRHIFTSWCLSSKRCNVNLIFVLRYGTWLIASWRPTTSATLATWTQWPSLQMALSVHLVERYHLLQILLDFPLWLHLLWTLYIHQVKLSLKVLTMMKTLEASVLTVMIKRLFLSGTCP